MKIKEKLAQDFTSLIDRETIDARSTDTKQRATDRAYLAGFDRAKQEAFKLVNGPKASEIAMIGEEEEECQEQA